MLAYAANHCGWKEHGQQLVNGGEFLAHVCVLMAHLGLTEQYQIQKQPILQHWRTKLSGGLRSWIHDKVFGMLNDPSYRHKFGFIRLGPHVPRPGYDEFVRAGRLSKSNR